MKVLEQTREALFKVFGELVSSNEAEAKRLIEQHTHVPENEPGGWAPNSVVVIIAEAIPLPGLYEVRDIDAWDRVSEEIPGHFVEHVNAAVAAVYEV